jgi:hypothetical protein
MLNEKILSFVTYCGSPPPGPGYRTRTGGGPKASPGFQVTGTPAGAFLCPASNTQRFCDSSQAAAAGPPEEKRAERAKNEKFPLFIPRAAARRSHRGIRPMVYILKGKVSSIWLRLMAIIWTASSDAARQPEARACGNLKAAARCQWGNAEAVDGPGPGHSYSESEPQSESGRGRFGLRVASGARDNRDLNCQSRCWAARPL